MALRRATPEIRYVKGPHGREVDFVARMPDGSRMLVQVCESLAEPRTRKREVRALDRTMAELGLRAATIGGPGGSTAPCRLPAPPARGPGRR